MKNQPRVSIVILNFNGKNVLVKCLESVAQINYPNFEIVLVDNNSQDGSLQEAKEVFPSITFIENPQNLGFSKGNNVGIRHALKSGADYVLLLNNDTLVEKDFLEKLIHTAQKRPKAGIICPLIYGSDKDVVWFSRGKIDWLRMKTSHEQKELGGKPYQSEFITGCAMLVPRKVFEKIGLLGEDFFLYWEDADFCFRTQRAGFETIVEPKSKIYHLEQSESVNEKKVYWLVLSALIFFEKNCPWYLKPWIYFYIKVRELNNWVNRKIGNNEFSDSVHSAFKDFKNARF